jgi:shikimate kinase
MEQAAAGEKRFSSGRIYLLGMMGVGKTTLGKQLARQLHYSFLDLDKTIEQEEGKTVTSIFEQSGESYFREAEQRALHATAKRDHIVIATGGGTPCYYDNIVWMNQQGLTVYLRANAAFVLSRVGAYPDKRPLLKGKSQAEMEIFIQQLIETRSPYYEAALKRIDLPVKSLLDIVKSMV